MNKKAKGFTLTELIVVIAIIAILAAVLIPTLTGYIQKARLSNDTVLQSEMNKALERLSIEFEQPTTIDEVRQFLMDEQFSLEPKTSSMQYFWNPTTNKIELIDLNSTSFTASIENAEYVMIPETVATDQKYYCIKDMSVILEDMANSDDPLALEFDRNSHEAKYYGLIKIMEEAGDVLIVSGDAKGTYNTKVLKNITEKILIIDKSVTTIAGSSDNDTSVTNVIIANTVTTIGERGFQNFMNLVEVVFTGNELGNFTTIGAQAFNGCIALSKIDIPNSVNSIGASAFKKCASITSTNIPEGVTKLLGSTYEGCSKLDYVKIPNSLTEMGNKEFASCSELKKITFPNSSNFKKIGENFFLNCTSLIEVEIPSSVTSIGKYIFKGCTSLKSVILPEGITSILADTFSGCKSLTSITLPMKITKIDNNAFSGCERLSSIIIPSSVTTLGSYAFSNCTLLKEVTILNSGLPKLSDNVFENCSSLTTVSFPSDSLANLEFGSKAFAGCENLSMISGKPIIDYVLNNTVEIDSFSGTNMFANGEDIIYVGNEIKAVNPSIITATIKEGVTSIPEGAFKDCTALTTVVLPSTLISIGQSSQAKDTFNNSVNYNEYMGGLYLGTIDNPYFALISVPQTTEGEFVIHKNTEIIAAYALYLCYKITKITIPTSVVSINEYAFVYCKALTSIIVPINVVYMESFVFRGCTGLQSINCEATSQPAGWNQNWNGSKCIPTWPQG